MLFEQRDEVTLIHDEKFDFGIEGAELADLLILLGDESLFQYRQLDEESSFGKIEVRTERLHRDADVIPLERELNRLIGPREAVEVQEAREGLLTGVGEPVSCGTASRLGCRSDATRRSARGRSRRTGLPLRRRELRLADGGREFGDHVRQRKTMLKTP